MSGKINKNGKEYPLGFMPEHYLADRVYLDGNTSKTVQDAVNALSGLRIYRLTGTSASTVNTNVYIPIPNGVTVDKMYILGTNIRNSTYGWYYSNPSSVTCLADSSNGIRLSVSEESFTSQPFSVLLAAI